MDYSVMLKKIRESLLLTQEELAKVLGTSFASVNRWENGHYSPTMKMKRKIRALCVKHKISEDK